jgi:hypothetical protein
MEIWTGTATKYGKKGASGATVITVTTTQVLRGSDGKELTNEVSVSAILLPSGSFLPDTFTTEDEATTALDKYEDDLTRKRRHAP